MSEPTEGWGWPSNSKKAHYFVDGRALCLRWAFFGTLYADNHDSADNCAECKKRRAQREAKVKKPQP